MSDATKTIVIEGDQESTTIKADGTKIGIKGRFAAVVFDGVRIERTANGQIVVSSGSTSVSLNAANDAGAIVAETSVPAIGDSMPDGTKYAGLGAKGKLMYAAPADEPGVYAHYQVEDQVRRRNAENYLGHNDWRAPTRTELNTLFNNKAQIGGFDETGSYPRGWYLSSSLNHHLLTWTQRFSDGLQHNDNGLSLSSLRLVR